MADVDKAVRAGHAIRGAALNVAAGSLARVAAVVERGGREIGIDAVAQLIDPFEREVRRLSEFARRLQGEEVI